MTRKNNNINKALYYYNTTDCSSSLDKSALPHSRFKTKKAGIKPAFNGFLTERYVHQPANTAHQRQAMYRLRQGGVLQPLFNNFFDFVRCGPRTLA